MRKRLVRSFLWSLALLLPAAESHTSNITVRRTNDETSHPESLTGGLEYEPNGMKYLNIVNNNSALFSMESLKVRCTDKCEGRCGIAKEKPHDAIQIFYYPWYEYSPNTTENQWRHWNSKSRINGGPGYLPPHDIPSPFYPKLGAYSSSNISVIDKHMQWMKQAGIGVVIVSWWGRESYEEERVWDILHAADNHKLKVAFYIEPYGGGYVRVSKANPNVTEGTRTPWTAQSDVKYLIDTYGCHRTFHRHQKRPVFLFFAAREYMSGRQDDWKLVWDELHANPEYNPFVITHDTKLEKRIIDGGWDGGHDYSCPAALERAKYWKSLASEYKAAGKIFYFTVCPGKDKSRLSPGNEVIIERENGDLYQQLWQAATEAKQTSSVVVVNSFNEWHVGSSIEPAIPKEFSSYYYKGMNISSYQYKDYEGAFGTVGQEAEFAYIIASRRFSEHYLNAMLVKSKVP